MLVAPNNNFFEFAYKYNLDYIISVKKDYSSFIQTGLTFIQNCKSLTTETILVTNTETIIHTSTLIQTLNRFTGIFNFTGPSKIGYVDTKSNTLYNIRNDQLFIANWFFFNIYIFYSL